jgi:hypothetical protein
LILSLQQQVAEKKKVLSRLTNAYLGEVKYQGKELVQQIEPMTRRAEQRQAQISDLTSQIAEFEKKRVPRSELEQLRL